eukprot:scaffold69702_cov19-Prasinocladus_malaysianus.AAC.1
MPVWCLQHEVPEVLVSPGPPWPLLAGHSTHQRQIVHVQSSIEHELILVQTSKRDLCGYHPVFKVGIRADNDAIYTVGGMPLLPSSMTWHVFLSPLRSERRLAAGPQY